MPKYLVTIDRGDPFTVEEPSTIDAVARIVDSHPNAQRVEVERASPELATRHYFKMLKELEASA